MEKTNRIIPHIYGYAVCLTAIIVLLISISMIVNAIFSLQDPLRSNSNRYFGPTANVSSFEAYKIDVLTGRGTITSAIVKEGGAAPQEQYTPSDAELRSAYDAARADHIAAVKLDSTKSITNGVLLILVALGLFLSHWTWLTRINKA